MIQQAANVLAETLTPHRQLADDITELIADYISDWDEEEIDKVRRVRGQNRWYVRESFDAESEALSNLKNYMHRLEKSLLVIAEIGNRIEVGDIAFENGEQGINVMFDLPSADQPGSAFIIQDDDLDVTEDKLAKQIIGWIENGDNSNEWEWI